jgi:hypothetical protein
MIADLMNASAPFSIPKCEETLIGPSNGLVWTSFVSELAKKMPTTHISTWQCWQSQQHAKRRWTQNWAPPTMPMKQPRHGESLEVLGQGLGAAPNYEDPHITTASIIPFSRVSICAQSSRADPKM